MAKTQLLRDVVYKTLANILIAGATQALACGSQVCNADVDIREPTRGWVMDTTNEALQLMQKEALVNFEKLQQERGRMEDFSRIVNPEASLRVFVSSTMPIETLKSYYRACAKYGGVMVFKGLPNGSFKELYKLVADITASGNKQEGKEEAAMQIDDEVFTKFEITHVPAIVISKESDCLFNQSCHVMFDKVSGNIGIKRALEEFAGSGDLSAEAARILAGRN